MNIPQMVKTFMSLDPAFDFPSDLSSVQGKTDQIAIYGGHKDYHGYNIPDGQSLCIDRTPESRNIQEGEFDEGLKKGYYIFGNGNWFTGRVDELRGQKHWYNRKTYWVGKVNDSLVPHGPGHLV